MESQEWDKWVKDSIGRLESRLDSLEKVMDKRVSWLYDEICTLRNSVINIIKPILTVEILKVLQQQESTRKELESSIGVDFKDDRWRYHAFDEALKELLESGQLLRIGHGRGRPSTYKVREGEGS